LYYREKGHGLSRKKRRREEEEEEEEEVRHVISLPVQTDRVSEKRIQDTTKKKRKKKTLYRHRI
jgi:hypothetical protein